MPFQALARKAEYLNQCGEATPCTALNVEVRLAVRAGQGAWR